MKYSIKYTNAFKRDYRRIIRRGFDGRLIEQVVIMIASGEPLPKEYRDHPLSGDFAGYRECHIRPDWLLIYKVKDDTLILTLMRTGTHSDLFNK